MTKSANTPTMTSEGLQAPAGTAPPGRNMADLAGEAAPTKMSKKRKGVFAGLGIALLILALLFIWYLLNRKPLSELPGLSSSMMPHYEMSYYGVTHPLGVAVSASGDRVYVTESDGQRVVRAYDHAGKQTAILKPPASTGVGQTAHLPMYVAINPTTQDVYVSDRLTSSIYIYDANGKYLRTFAPKGNLGGKWNPLGLAFAPDGTLYVTDVRGEDTKNHRIVAFSPDGTLVRSIGKPGTLSFPNGIVVDSHGNIEVSDSNNGRLVVFNAAGTVLATIAQGIGEGDLGLPRGAAVDDAGRLYVVDTSDHQVRIFKIGDLNAPMPTYIGSFGTEGQLDGTFEYPNGVATDKRAHIYITDRENNRVQVWGY
jgi:DNA-binding beta-propeller fold protein YncE